MALPLDSAFVALSPGSLADWVNVCLQAILFVVFAFTLLYARRSAAAAVRAAAATMASVDELRASRAASLRPRLSVSFGFGRHKMAEVVVANHGVTPAYDAVLVFDPPLQSKTLPEAPSVLDLPIACLPPGERIEHLIDWWPAYRKADLPSRYTVHVTYREAISGQVFHESAVLDVRLHQQILRGNRPKGVPDLVDECKSVAKSMKQLAETAKRAHARVRLPVAPSSPDERSIFTAVRELYSTWALLSWNTEYVGELDWEVVGPILRDQTLACISKASSVPLTPEQRQSLRNLVLGLLNSGADSLGGRNSHAVAASMRELAEAFFGGELTFAEDLADRTVWRER
jgi:hypothetical protein